MHRRHFLALASATITGAGQAGSITGPAPQIEIGPSLLPDAQIVAKSRNRTSIAGRSGTLKADSWQSGPLQRKFRP